MRKILSTETQMSALAIDINAFDYHNTSFIGIFFELYCEYFTQYSALQYADFYIEQAQTEDSWSVIIYNTLTNNAIQSFAQQLNKMAALNSELEQWAIT
jgi:hypothetical protein